VTETLVEVRLLGVPVQALSAAAEHHDDLVRELGLLHHAYDAETAPARLVQVSGRLSERFRQFSGDVRAALTAAIERGDDHIDLVVRVPADAGDAALELDGLLDEVDEYCRSGAGLLTTAPTPGIAAVRKWYLLEFIRQSGGDPPTGGVAPGA
jgi:hypothetical protein